jgi:hypothetical protein
VKGARSSAAVGRHALGALIASGLLLAGCGTPRFAREPQPAVDLSGHWVLEPAASDDAAQLIAAITPKPRPRPTANPQSTGLPQSQDGGGRGGSGSSGGRQGERRGGRGDGQSDGRAGLGPEQLPAWGRVRPGEFISAFALPPPKLEIEQQPTRVRVGADARRRDFEPGDEQPFSVTDRYGSRKVSAGWQHDEFLISSADGSRLKVVEHFRHRADDHLELLVEFSANGLKSLKVHSRYRRATSAELAAPSPDGPPAPAPR